MGCAACDIADHENGPAQVRQVNLIEYGYPVGSLETTACGIYAMGFRIA